MYLSRPTQSIAFIDTKLLVWSSVKCQQELLLFSPFCLILYEPTWCEFPIWTLLLTKQSNHTNQKKNTVLGSKDQNRARFLTSTFFTKLFDYRMSVWKEIHCSCYKFSSIISNNITMYFTLSSQTQSSFSGYVLLLLQYKFGALHYGHVTVKYFRRWCKTVNITNYLPIPLYIVFEVCKKNTWTEHLALFST